MMAGTPTGTAAADRTWPPAGRELWWLPRSRLSNGEAMPDRAALIEEQIPGLRRFACALLRGDREGADDLVQDTLERALSHWNLRRNRRKFKGLALHDPLQPVFVRSASRAAARPTRRVVGGDRTAGDRRRAAFGAGASGSAARLCGIAGGAAGGASVGRRRGPLLPGGGACTGSAHRHGDVEAFARARAFAAHMLRRYSTKIAALQCGAEESEVRAASPSDRRGRPAGVGRWPADPRGERGRRGLFCGASRVAGAVVAICRAAGGIARSLRGTGREADTRRGCASLA